MHENPSKRKKPISQDEHFQIGSLAETFIFVTQFFLPSLHFELSPPFLSPIFLLTLIMAPETFSSLGFACTQSSLKKTFRAMGINAFADYRHVEAKKNREKKKQKNPFKQKYFSTLTYTRNFHRLLPSKLLFYVQPKIEKLFSAFFCLLVRWKIDLPNNILLFWIKLCFFESNFAFPCLACLSILRVENTEKKLFACFVQQEIMTNCVNSNRTLDAKLDWNFKLSFPTWMSDFICLGIFILLSRFWLKKKFGRHS